MWRVSWGDEVRTRTVSYRFLHIDTGHGQSQWPWSVPMAMVSPNPSGELLSIVCAPCEQMGLRLSYERCVVTFNYLVLNNGVANSRARNNLLDTRNPMEVTMHFRHSIDSDGSLQPTYDELLVVARVRPPMCTGEVVASMSVSVMDLVVIRVRPPMCTGEVVASMSVSVMDLVVTRVRLPMCTGEVVANMSINAVDLTASRIAMVERVFDGKQYQTFAVLYPRLIQ